MVCRKRRNKGRRGGAGGEGQAVVEAGRGGRLEAQEGSVAQ